MQAKSFGGALAKLQLFFPPGIFRAGLHRLLIRSKISDTRPADSRQSWAQQLAVDSLARTPEVESLAKSQNIGFRTIETAFRICGRWRIEQWTAPR
jgi:hypothetical protein